MYTELIYHAPVIARLPTALSCCHIVIKRDRPLLSSPATITLTYLQPASHLSAFRHGELAVRPIGLPSLPFSDLEIRYTTGKHYSTQSSQHPWPLELQSEWRYAWNRGQERILPSSRKPHRICYVLSEIGEERFFGHFVPSLHKAFGYVSYNERPQSRQSSDRRIHHCIQTLLLLYQRPLDS